MTAHLPDLPPRQRGALALWVEGTLLVLDPRLKGPRKQDDLLALVISVVYRQHAIPVAWHIVGAQERKRVVD